MTNDLLKAQMLNCLLTCFISLPCIYFSLLLVCLLPYVLFTRWLPLLFMLALAPWLFLPLPLASLAPGTCSADRLLRRCGDPGTVQLLHSWESSHLNSLRESFTSLISKPERFAKRRFFSFEPAAYEITDRMIVS